MTVSRFSVTTPARHPRLLIVPGLHDSGPVHWQTWLQGLHRGAVRVEVGDWHAPDLDRWSDAIARTLASQPHHGEPWWVAAHSFGCLGVVHHLLQRPDLPIEAALLVAPADPDKFGLAHRLSHDPLPTQATLIASSDDPWLSAEQARLWAGRWGCGWHLLNGAGHINAEAGFGPLPLAQRWVQAQQRRRARERRGAVESGASAGSTRSAGSPDWASWQRAA